MHQRLRIAIASSLVLLMFGVAACSSNSDEAENAPANEAVGEQDPGGTEGSAAPDNGGAGGDTIVAQDLAFDPTELSVATGTEITVENLDSVEHTFTVDGTDIDEDLAAGDTVGVTIDLEAGEYPWHCTIHTSMTGTLTVT
jgi:plastocyanin